MPRFRLKSPLPILLHYRGGARVLVHTFEGMYGDFQLQARREDLARYTAVPLYTARNALAFAEALAQGFEVRPGAAEAALMRALCERGHAEEIHG